MPKKSPVTRAERLALHLVSIWSALRNVEMRWEIIDTILDAMVPHAPDEKVIVDALLDYAEECDGREDDYAEQIAIRLIMNRGIRFEERAS